jgi:hypothetical protein
MEPTERTSEALPVSDTWNERQDLYHIDSLTNGTGDRHKSYRTI